MAKVQISNQSGEAGGIFVNTTGVQTGNFVSFKFVEDTIFASIENSLFVNVTGAQGKEFYAGDVLILPGTTNFNLTSGSLFVYNSAE